MKQEVKYLKGLISKAILLPAEDIQLLHDGKLLLKEESLIQSEIVGHKNIIAISASDGGDCLKFTQVVMDTDINDLEYLKSSLQSLIYDIKKLEKLFIVNKAKAKDLKQRKSELKDVSEGELVSIMLWMSGILDRELNALLGRNEDLSQWKVYLKTLLIGLKSMPYYRGKVYRGTRDFKDLKTYKKGKIVVFKAMSGFSKNKNIAERFSNINGTIFEVEVCSARDLSSLSDLPEDILMLAYSYFEVIDVIETKGKPVYVKLKEIPTPRSPKVVLWVDENPERNESLVRKIEQNEISCLFCLSTNDAFRVIERYQWLLSLENTDFKIITSMARSEDGVLNSHAGVDLIERMVNDYQYKFKIQIFCQDPKEAQEECNARQLNRNFSITNDSRDVLEFLNL